MPLYPNRHRLTLFSLKPLNKQAENVVNEPCNRHLTSKLTDGTTVLDIGFQIRSRTHHTLATLGRGVDTDVFVGGANISKLQCSFEIEPATNVIMLYDRSHSMTTQVFGNNVVPFEHGRIRRVVVQKGLNSHLGMGGIAQNTVQFEFIWYQDFPEMAEMIKDRESIINDCQDNSCMARTADELDTVLPSQMQTRIHTPGPRQLKMRYMKLRKLGSGQFGAVYKALDYDTGKLLAVKILQQPEQSSEEAGWRKLLKREVETLSRINHPHIVEYITSEGWEGSSVEIFMGLKDGTLGSLVLNAEVETIPSLAETALRQMLQALDYLAVNGIVHRDVKPENILYTALADAQYRFYLGDFGLCNRTVDAQSFVGTPLYTAPEVYHHGVQTHKMDIWSLFITILWTLDFDGFRENLYRFTSVFQIHQAIIAIRSRIGDIQHMARVDPDERASAAQMLVKCFNGEGLSTHPNRIPELKTKPETKTEPELHPRPLRQVIYQPVQGIQKPFKQPKDQFHSRKSSIPQARISGPKPLAATPKKHRLPSNVEFPGFGTEFWVRPLPKD